MMIVYLGKMKDSVSVAEVEEELVKLNLKFVKYYPKLQIVQFTSNSEINFKISVFDLIEKERNIKIEE